MNEAVLGLSGVARTFRQGDGALPVLRGASLEVGAGETVAVVGASGTGKSTLLQIAGLLERPDDGEVVVAGEACGRLADARRAALRRTAIGFVYQSHRLLPEFSALENVVLPQMIAGAPRRRARDKARALLGRVGLSARARHRPARLSGGEQQRIAVVRALANDPRLVVADEPTGNLDRRTAEDVFSLLLALARGGGVAVLVATHDRDLASRMDRRLLLRDGVLEAA